MESRRIIIVRGWLHNKHIRFFKECGCGVGWSWLALVVE